MIYMMLRLVNRFLDKKYVLCADLPVEHEITECVGGTFMNRPPDRGVKNWRRPIIRVLNYAARRESFEF